MTTIKNLERLRQLHYLIECETTGSPKELSRRLHVSERMVYHLIEQLKDYDAKIRYDRSRRTYHYQEDFHLEVNISVCVVSNDQVTELYGS